MMLKARIASAGSPGSRLNGEDEVVEEGNTTLAAQLELVFVQGIYFISHSYVITTTARLMWDRYDARI
jgi:hypothetical protein